MTELVTSPPPADALAAMAAIDGVKMSPTMLVAQRGPDGHLGPEAVGAVLILQATFSNEERAAGFWRRVAELMRELSTAPGFIRRYSFADGPTGTLIAFWQTKEAAKSFFNSDAHRAAMRDLYRERWQYTHFASLFESTSPRHRVMFCEACDGVTPMPADVCESCGTPILDPVAV